jgi:hypothetical protein
VRPKGCASANAGVLSSRYTPAVVGLAWAALAWFTWGSLHPMPLDHDEVAYLLQSQIFASGRWAASLSDFFGQAHVLVPPVLALLAAAPRAGGYLYDEGHDRFVATTP